MNQEDSEQNEVDEMKKGADARMSKIINDSLSQSDTGCFISVPIWQQWVLKG